MLSIGIFSITLSKIGYGTSTTDNGVSKAYVDWIHSLSEQSHVVLIPHDCTRSQLRRYLRSIHGLIIPGGNDDIHHPSSPYYQHIQYALDYAKEHKLPVFGICAGFMAMVSYELGTWPLHVNVYNVLSTAGSQKLYKKSHRSQALLETEKALAYNHHYGVDAGVLKRHANIRVVAVAPQGYASMLEWKHLPWMATQWHPEKPAWEPSKKQNIPRSPAAISVGKLVGSFFLSHVQTYAKQNKVLPVLEKGTWVLRRTPSAWLQKFDMPMNIYVYSAIGSKSKST